MRERDAVATSTVKVHIQTEGRNTLATGVLRKRARNGVP